MRLVVLAGREALAESRALVLCLRDEMRLGRGDFGSPRLDFISVSQHLVSCVEYAAQTVRNVVPASTFIEPLGLGIVEVFVVR
jgi:hypothetical protein